jgi:hypothetical protein
MHPLENKFVLHSGPESYCTGQIVAVLDGAVLVQFDLMHNPELSVSFPMELVSMEELVHAEAGGIKVWGFFDTRAKLDAYVAWLEGPSKPALVKLVPKKPPPVEPS